MTIVLHIEKKSNEVLSGSFDYLQEKMCRLPIDSISFDEELLKFEIKTFSVKFEGTLASIESEISGQWVQYGKLFPIIFKKGIEAFKVPNRPQEPKKPYPLKKNLSFMPTQEQTLT